MAKSQHRPDLAKVYRRRVQALDLNSLRWRTQLLRPAVIRPHGATIDPLIESLTWRYEPGDPVMHGELGLRQRTHWDGARIAQGDTLRLDVFWFGRWTECWRMMLRDPQDQLASGVTFTLDEPTVILQESRDDFHYVKSKKGGHPNGWRCDQIVRDVAKRYHIKLGRVAKGRRQIHSLSYDGYSPLQIIQRAYALERAETGHRYVIRYRNGRLEILPMRRNPLLYALSDQIQDGLLGLTERGDGFATAYTARATIKDGKKTKKVSVVVQDKDAVRKYGFIHRVPRLGDVKDVTHARNEARRRLNKHAQRKRTLTGVTHPAIPLIYRGDAIEVSVPSRGLTGAQAIGFISAGTWSLSSGEAVMSLDLTFDDPFVTTTKARKAKDKATRKRKAAHHG